MNYRILSTLYIVVLFFGCVETRKNTSLIDYTPHNSSVIIKINDLEVFRESLHNNNFASQLISSRNYNAVVNKIKTLQYIQLESESILSFSSFKDEDFDFTFITHANQNLFKTDSLQNKIIEATSYKHTSYKKYQVEESTFYKAVFNNTIIISSSETILNQIQDQIKNNKTKPELERLYKISDDTTPASIFIDLKETNPFIFPWIKNSKTVIEFADWTALDCDINDAYVNLNGISIANDSTKNYINLFKNTNPLTNTTPSFAPIDTDAIVSYTYDNHKTFSNNQNAYSPTAKPIDSVLNTVEEIGFIYLKNKKAVLLNTYGAINITEHLNSIKKKTIEYQGSEIIELTENDFLNKRLNPIIKNYNSNFYTIIEDAFVFTEELESLEIIIRNYKNGNTFNKTPVYRTAMKKLAEESSILYISNSKNIDDDIQNQFSNDFHKEIKEITTDAYSYAVQAIADKNFYHTNIIVKKIEEENVTTQVNPIFSIQLEADIASKPQFVKNHITHKKEIIVQDINNTLYLISRKGEIIWKKELKAAIQGKITQVDIFKNGRLQLAFTTNNQFIVLDRNGKEVKQFTKSYDGGNLNPLSVFDYEGKKDYRFVVTQGRKVFMYNSKASIVSGFKYTRAEKAIIAAPKHIKIRGKDFLLFKLEDGSLKILNRVGNVRTKVKEKINFSENNVFAYKNKFALTDKKGVLYQIDEKGKTNKTSLNLSTDHGFYSTSKTLAIMNDNILSIRGKEIELELGVYTAPKIFYIYDKIYVTVTDLQHQKVYLFDSQANPIPNFPVYGTSAIDLSDLDNDKKLEFVTKDQENALIIYQMN